MTRIVIADDHSIVRRGLKHLFTITPGLELVAEAANGDEVLAALRQTACDLLIMDLNMPGLSGPDLITRVKAHLPKLPILVLSMHNTAQVASRALKAGASGYITKDCEPEDLVAAIRQVTQGRRYIAATVAQEMALLSTSNDDLLAHAALSDREFEIFKLLTKGHSLNDIADQLSISAKTVSTHKMRLMEKLKTSSMAELMLYAMEHQLLG